MTLSRRQVLGGGLLFVGGAALGLALRPGRSAVGSILGDRLGVLEAVAEVFLPEGEGARVARAIDDFLVHAGDPVLVGELVLGLGVIEHLGGGLFARFSARSLDERRAVFAAWSQSGLGLKRQLYQAMRRLTLFSFYADPVTWSHSGYDGTWVGRDP